MPEALGHAGSAWPPGPWVWVAKKNHADVETAKWLDSNKNPGYQGSGELPRLAISCSYCHMSFVGGLSISPCNFSGKGPLEAQAWFFLDFISCTLCPWWPWSVSSHWNKPRALESCEFFQGAWGCSWDPGTADQGDSEDALFKDGVYHKTAALRPDSLELIPVHYNINLRKVYLLSKTYILLILRELVFTCLQVFLYYTSCWVITRERVDTPTGSGKLLHVRTLCTIWKCYHSRWFWHCKNVVAELWIFLRWKKDGRQSTQ